MDWYNIAQFNYTEAMLGGAWLRDRNGNTDWCSEKEITEHKGPGWFHSMIKKQGWMTGCWINV